MNLFTFSGNLGRDAEVKFLPSGSTVCEFSVAVRSGYGDREKTTWVRCALFGKRAEGNLPQYLVKGAQVFCSGELELQEWEGQNGKGAAVAVTIDKLDLAGGKGEGAPQGQPQQQQAPAQPAAQPQSFGSFGGLPPEWQEYKPTAKTKGATLQQVHDHAQINGNLQAAINAGFVEKGVESYLPF